jgi:prepilin-type processing-associated H-X9-DG protein
MWHCPTAQVMAGDTFTGGASSGGQFGVFSYVMDLDFKLKQAIKGSTTGTAMAYQWPLMPKLTTLRQPSAQVFLAEQAFSQTLEPYVNGIGPNSSTQNQRNGLLPAQRWSVFTQRHNKGGNIVFVDGHSARFKWSYVVAAPLYKDPTGGDSRAEPLNPDIWWNPNRDINY